MAQILSIGVDFGNDTPNQRVDRLTSTIDQAVNSAKLTKKQRIDGIGIGIAGQVDSDAGLLRGAPNLSQATIDLPLAPLITDRYKTPTRLMNDVQIAAIGEARFGAGRNVDLFLCVFVGTGIGGAIVVDGSVQLGASGSAGEIGHLVVHANGRICGCGGRGHLEAYASRTAITQSILGELKRGRPSALRELAPELLESSNGGSALRSGLLAKAIDAGDALCIETVEEAANYLGLGIGSAISLLNPAKIIVGGGVVESVPMLFEGAASKARQEALPAPAATVRIERAALGDHAGVIGAALVGIGADVRTPRHLA
jgi:glucokinase